jgi:D-sedoheptulose 7-phosphate isomerase
MSKIIKFPAKQYLKGNKYFEDYIKIKDLLLRNVDQKVLHKITQEILNTIQKKRDFFSCGNGGSATTAEHLSCDFSKGSCTNTNLNIKVHSLNSNVALMTAIANDISYDDIFSYQLNRFGKANDILLTFSVSGASKNIIKCAKIAKKKKIKIISFTGFDGGELKKLSNYNINFSSNNFGIVEDCHLTIMHYISQYIRNLKFKDVNKISKINF